MLSDSFVSEPAQVAKELEVFLDKVKSCGAVAVEGIITETIAFESRVRLGKKTDLDHAEERTLGLRAFIGKRKADVSLSLAKIKNFDAVAERLVSMARLAPEDPYCGLAERTAAPHEVQDLEIYDSAAPSIDGLVASAIEAEAAALAHKGISNSEGASAGWDLSQSVHLTSTGFQGVEKETFHHLSCSVLAEKNGAMERDYEFSTSHFSKDLDSPKAVGDKAATQTLARLGAVKPASTKAMVVLSPRVSRSILGHLASAISGGAVARQTSFLKDALGEKIFNEAIQITDDPFRKRGLRSQAFDGEGVLGAPQNFIEAGVLQNFFMDSAAARQLQRESTGHAGGVTNFYLTSAAAAASAAPTPEALIGGIDKGFYITELIGMGVNIVTGDYSRGASGFLIEKGKITQPVNEMTIAGNLQQIFSQLVACDDLNFRYGVDAPTLCLGQMTIAAA